MVVLVTGAGAPGTRGTAYALRSNHERVPLRLVGVDVRASGVGPMLVDTFRTVPAPEDASYLDELLAVCRDEGVRIVIPQTTREIVALAHHRHVLAAAGIGTMVSSSDAITLANDKWRLLETFKALALPVPRATLARSEAELLAAADGLGYPENPVVVKPPVSNGMRGVRVLRESAWDVTRFLSEKPSGLEISLAELVGILRRGSQWPALVVTEYLPGEEYSVDCFVGSRARVAIPRRRVAIRSGITFESELDPRADLQEYALTAARHIGLQYAVGFQFKLDAEGVPKILEANPRVQGTMVASLFSGVNVIWLSVQELLGNAPEAAAPVERESAFYRYWGGIAVTNGRYAEI